ncbi:MAG: DNA translocase FtsK 4TM domain-containing protein, partial [Candidatus Omnitrophica bacterium]|nr:DNA translocase FtsK 4TM domain-containing protein [Candidatus Omnitrophota bacterium]
RHLRRPSSSTYRKLIRLRRRSSHLAGWRSQRMGREVMKGALRADQSIPARVASVCIGASGLFTLLAVVSYHPADLALLSSEPNHPLRNIGGVIGAWVGLIGRGGFGWAALLLPLLAGIWSARTWRARALAERRWATKLMASVFLLGSAATVMALSASDPTRQATLGGVVGYLGVRAGRYYLGPIGTALLAMCVAYLSWTLVVETRILPQRWGAALHMWWRAAWERFTRRTSAATSSSPLPRRASVALPAAHSAKVARSPIVTRKPQAVPTPLSPAKLARVRSASGGFQLPSLDLLTQPPPLAQRHTGPEEDPMTNARILEETLREFGIEATVVNIDRGPTVTRYELQPAPGVKLTKIVSLADDLALVLKAASCHIVAPIPGKGLVGIDVPNTRATTVYVRDLMTSREFAQLHSPLALGIGMDVSGHPLVADLRECPHLLIAGTTGSGKTVCLNSLLCGILYQASPDDVKFLMIDPKKVELVLFNDIPHLVAPVVTDAKRAAAALAWAVTEMERRYQVLAKAGVRNIDGYNQKVGAKNDPESPRMPYLVIVIDELADLMIIASQDVEEAITRLSQLSRAVGLHIILATQRPSVDVITGVIKANFPARIAFQVASKVDSRTILDMNGADKLLGKGDLLFLRPGTAKPIRAQSGYVTDGEIERLVNFLKSQRAPSYDEQLLVKQDQPAEFGLMGEKDELYDMAKRIVLETGQASTSFLQRRLRLGYGRAARILDQMEQEGLVGPAQGSRPREILAKAETAQVAEEKDA